MAAAAVAASAVVMARRWSAAGAVVERRLSGVEGARTGKMTAEPSVRHVLSSREGLCFRSVSFESHASRCREIVTRHRVRP